MLGTSNNKIRPPKRNIFLKDEGKIKTYCPECSTMLQEDPQREESLRWCPQCSMAIPFKDTTKEMTLQTTFPNNSNDIHLIQQKKTRSPRSTVNSMEQEISESPIASAFSKQTGIEIKSFKKRLPVSDQ